MNTFSITTTIRKILEIESRKKVIQGGSSAGKTVGIISILLDTAARYQNKRISVVSHSLPHLKRGAIRDFLQIMKTTNRYRDNHWNRTDKIYTFGNNSYIEFFSADNQDKVKGPRRDILYINECNNINEETYRQLSIRTDEDIYLDFNPEAEFWAHHIEDAELIKVNYKDNEALQETIIQELESYRDKAKNSEYWANWVKVYLDGEVGRLQGAVFQNWDIIENIPQEAVLLSFGVDFGFNDPATCVGVYLYDDKLVLDECLYESKLTPSSLSTRLKNIVGTGLVYADHDPGLISEIRKYGVNIRKASKPAGSINYGIHLLQDYKMLVTKRSDNLIDELYKYKWKQDKSGQIQDTPIDDYNHCIDAVRYAVIERLGRSFNSSPKVFNKNVFKNKNKNISKSDW